MPVKGTTNNPAGRPKGIPNKTTAELRDRLRSVLEAEFEKLPSLLSKLSVSERVRALTTLAQYVLPKLEAVSLAEGPPCPELHSEPIIILDPKTGEEFDFNINA